MRILHRIERCRISKSPFSLTLRILLILIATLLYDGKTFHPPPPFLPFLLPCMQKGIRKDNAKKSDPCIKTSAMFLHLEAMLLQMQFHTFEKRALLYSSAISKYFELFPIDGQRFLQLVFGFQLQCFVFLFSGVKRPRQYRTQYILSLAGHLGHLVDLVMPDPCRSLLVTASQASQVTGSRGSRGRESRVGAVRVPEALLAASVYLTRLNIHHTVLYYSEPQWKDTLLPSFLTCSSGTTTMTFSGASLPVEQYSTVWWIFNLLSSKESLEEAELTLSA